MNPGRLFIWLVCLTLCSPASVRAQLPGGSDLARIGPREFVLDQARVLSQEQKQEIQSICSKLLDDRDIPIIVVTIRSMRDFPNRPQQIEGFARSVFNEWGIGFPTTEKNSWNRGMLILVSPGDRQARIELGADWAREQDAECARIMQEQMISYFRTGNFAGGILAGVRGLETLARLLKEPGPGEKLGAGQLLRSSPSDGQPHQLPAARPVPFNGPGGTVLGIIMLVMVVGFRLLLPILSLFGYQQDEGYFQQGSRRYSSRWLHERGYSKGAFSDMDNITNRGRFFPRSGGSSFGGGSSGGGGATGSW